MKRSDTASELSKESESDELLISSRARSADAAAADCIASGTLGDNYCISFEFFFSMFMAVKAADDFMFSNFVRGLIATIVA